MPSSIPQTSGIYQIRCVPTGKVYIGSAVNLRKRCYEHLRTLRLGVHHNAYLQRAWSKHGESQFEFTVLELVLSSFLLEREQYYFDKIRPFDPSRGYNLCSVAGSSFGLKRSELAKQKNSAARKGRPLPESTRKKMSEAHRGKPHPRTPEQTANLTIALRAHFSNPDAREAIHGKRWRLTAPSGEVYITGNLAEFARQHKLERRALAAVAMGDRRHHKGWICSYLPK